MSGPTIFEAAAFGVNMAVMFTTMAATLCAGAVVAFCGWLLATALWLKIKRWWRG